MDTNAVSLRDTMRDDISGIDDGPQSGHFFRPKITCLQAVKHYAGAAGLDPAYTISDQTTLTQAIVAHVQHKRKSDGQPVEGSKGPLAAFAQAQSVVIVTPLHPGEQDRSPLPLLVAGIHSETNAVDVCLISRGETQASLTANAKKYLTRHFDQTNCMGRMAVYALTPPQPYHGMVRGETFERIGTVDGWNGQESTLQRAFSTSARYTFSGCRPAVLDHAIWQVRHGKAGPSVLERYEEREQRRRENDLMSQLHRLYTARDPFTTLHTIIDVAARDIAGLAREEKTKIGNNATPVEEARWQALGVG